MYLETNVVDREGVGRGLAGMFGLLHRIQETERLLLSSELAGVDCVVLVEDGDVVEDDEVGR